MNTSFPATEAICRVMDPLDWNEAKCRTFIEAIREMAIFHNTHSREVRFLFEMRGFDPVELRNEADLERLPFLGVSAMKHFLLTSLPSVDAVLKLTSSGTRGQKTQVWFDGQSLSRVQAMLEGLWDQEGLVSDAPTNYLNFIYDPDEARDLGIAFSVKNEQRFAPVHTSYFTVHRGEEGQWCFEKKKTFERLSQYQRDALPVRILGIPSFIFELLEVLRDKGPMVLPRSSFVLTGGGWKAAEEKKISRRQFRELITEYLGIPHENIRDGFGMAEHSAPYIECVKHRFHIPVYNRILVRDPVTLAKVKDGEVGLLEFITPFNAMMPTTAILSTDLGCLDNSQCECGRKSPTFTLVGRAGLTKHKGCALTATEIVGRD